MFDFTIIVCADGMEIIDRRQKVSYCALTAVQMLRYIEMEIMLEIMDGMEQK